MPKTLAKFEAPEVIALQALAFIASEVDRLERFMQVSGIEPANLRARAGEPELLAAVLDHVLGDELLLFLFCEAHGLAAEAPRAARRALPGSGFEG